MGVRTKAILLVVVAVAIPAAAMRPGAADEPVVSITETGFAPREVQVRPGEVVTWRNDGSGYHSVVADDGTWESGLLGPGETYTHTFATSGEHFYHDGTHPDHKGKVLVLYLDFLPLVLRNWPPATPTRLPTKTPTPTAWPTKTPTPTAWPTKTPTPQPDACEPNDTPADACDLAPGTYDFYVDPAGDQDFFRLTLAADGRIVLTLSGIPAGCDFDLYLYTDPAGDPVDYSANAGNADEYISYQATAGTYYALVTHARLRVLQQRPLYPEI